jgi:hypothetical protein
MVRRAGVRRTPAGVAGLERIHEPFAPRGSWIRSIRSRASLRDARRTALTQIKSCLCQTPDLLFKFVFSAVCSMFRTGNDASTATF